MKVAYWVITSGEYEERVNKLIESCGREVKVFNYKDPECIEKYPFLLSRDTLFTSNFNRILNYELKGSNEAVLIMNDDIIWEEGSLDRLIKHAEETKGWATINPVHVSSEDSNKITMGGTGVAFPSGMHSIYLRDEYIEMAIKNNLPLLTSWRWIPFAAPLISLEALRAVGILDPNLTMWYSDSDWCMRAIGFGYNVILAQDCFIEHLLHGTIESEKQQEIFQRDYHAYYYKWSGKVLDLYSQNISSESME